MKSRKVSTSVLLGDKLVGDLVKAHLKNLLLWLIILFTYGINSRRAKKKRKQRLKAYTKLGRQCEGEHLF